MTDRWQTLAEKLAISNKQLIEENGKLRRELRGMAGKARSELVSSIVPLDALQQLSEEISGMSDEEVTEWFPHESEEQSRLRVLEKEVKVLEPTVEQLQYWGDRRNENDCMVRQVASQALKVIHEIRSEKEDNPSDL